MKKPLLFFSALIAIALVAYYSTYIEKVPVAIENDIATRAQAIFKRADMPWVTAKVNGRNITLVGVAPSQNAIKTAEKMVRIEGYTFIDNQLTLVAPPPLASKTGGFDYELSVSKSEKEQIILAGVLNKNSHRLVLESTVKRYGEKNVTDQIQVQNVMTPDFVGQSFDLVMQQLSQLKKGTAEFNQFNFTLKGIFLADISNNNFKQKINEHWVAKAVDVSSPLIRAPLHKSFRHKTDEALRKAEKCYADFKRIAVSSIRFKSASVVVKRASYRTLNKIATLAKKCDEFNLQIHGHTDSVGNASRNEKLSYGRAFTIVKYLVNKNIGLNRLEALGHGSSKPIASNRTKRGRAKNRRIEITIREQ